MLIKRQERKEGGITLVALVVTIIVLLILAGITIATLFGDNGAINKAQKAKEETEKSTQNELGALNSLEGEMENEIKGNTIQESGWRQPDPLKPEITNGEITLKIGDYVDYSCKNSTATYTSPASKSGHAGDQTFSANAYNYGWRVLGVDKDTKQLQLISEDFVPLTGRRR
jgi:type II secretory pathway pseudopilin PulG